MPEIATLENVGKVVATIVGFKALTMFHDLIIFLWPDGFYNIWICNHKARVEAQFERQKVAVERSELAELRKEKRELQQELERCRNGYIGGLGMILLVLPTRLDDEDAETKSDPACAFFLLV
ncbi:hypothetical protein F5884DRAFT_904937, partial [Xylogone sp. PMI_703]